MNSTMTTIFNYCTVVSEGISLFTAKMYSLVRSTSYRCEHLQRGQFVRSLIKNLSSAFKMSFVTFDEVKNLPNQPGAVLIDVRDPPEIKDTGIIPTSINIPLGTLEETLKLPADAFKDRFGRDKPDNDTELIFTCKLGGRATKAAEVATTLGYSNSKIYQGSWTEWAAKNGL